MEKKECSKFGDKLKELRKREKMTQSDLSNKLNINRVTITKYETGERTPTTDDIISLAKYFNVSTDYLLGITDNATTDTDLQAVCNYTGLYEKTVEKIQFLKSRGKISALNDIINTPDFLSLIDEVMNYNKAVYKIIAYYSKPHNFTNEDKNNIKTAKQYLENQGYIIKPFIDVVKSELDKAIDCFKSVIKQSITSNKDFMDDYIKNVHPKYSKYFNEMNDPFLIYKEVEKINELNDYIDYSVWVKLQTEVYENGKHNPPKK